MKSMRVVIFMFVLLSCHVYYDGNLVWELLYFIVPVLVLLSFLDIADHGSA